MGFWAALSLLSSLLIDPPSTGNFVGGVPTWARFPPCVLPLALVYFVAVSLGSVVHWDLFAHRPPLFPSPLPGHGIL